MMPSATNKRLAYETRNLIHVNIELRPFQGIQMQLIDVCWWCAIAAIFNTFNSLFRCGLEFQYKNYHFYLMAEVESLLNGNLHHIPVVKHEMACSWCSFADPSHQPSLKRKTAGTRFIRSLLRQGEWNTLTRTFSWTDIENGFFLQISTAMNSPFSFTCLQVTRDFLS
jgi:hypothetical protein